MVNQNIYPSDLPIIAPECILRHTCKTWNIDPRKVLGRGRTQPLAFGRQVCMKLMYDLTDLSISQVASIFDHRDHTTVIWAIKTVKAACIDKNIENLINKTIENIKHDETTK